MKETVYMGQVESLAKKYGAVVISVGYTFSPFKPYPAGFNDCYAALLYIKKHAIELGIREDQIMIGGESAGGGLCAAPARQKDYSGLSPAYTFVGTAEPFYDETLAFIDNMKKQALKPM